MDVVVWLALFVLGAVFVLSFLVLVLLCRRRLASAQPRLRFSKLHHDNLDTLIQLNPLIGSVLEKNEGLWDGTGVVQHSVAILRLTHALTQQLSLAPLPNVTPRVSQILSEATSRVLRQFDELLSSIAPPHMDTRIIESRATALVAVCWALVVPFSILSPSYTRGALGDPLDAMSSHLVCLRNAVEVLEKETGSSQFKWDMEEEEKKRVNGSPSHPVDPSL